MDSRLDLFGALGLALGDAHLIRNAGGLATEDAVRSLLLSQFLLGTRAIMVIQHTRCSLEAFNEEGLQTEIERQYGRTTPFGLGAHKDLEANVQATVAILSASPFIDNSEVRGFVFDVDQGDLREISMD
jgi:carbonic anhydrase